MKNGARYEKLRDQASPYRKILIQAMSSMGKYRISARVGKKNGTEGPIRFDQYQNEQE